jgi:hypothetical protein
MTNRKLFVPFSILILSTFFFISCQSCIECKVEYYKNGQFYVKTEDGCGTKRERDRFKESFCNSVLPNDSSSVCACDDTY